MLAVNPAKRPSLMDILAKPRVKKAVILYLRTSLKTASEGELHNINLDSLREQAEHLGLLSAVLGDADPNPRRPSVTNSVLNAKI